jgi:nitrate reductase cytochrome c-type subunit
MHLSNKTTRKNYAVSVSQNNSCLQCHKLYDMQNLQESFDVLVGANFVKDQWFQQLVECALCGVHVRQGTQEAERMKGRETLTRWESREMLRRYLMKKTQK